MVTKNLDNYRAYYTFKILIVISSIKIEISLFSNYHQIYQIKEIFQYLSKSNYLEHANKTNTLHAIISLNKSLFNFCIYIFMNFMHNDKLNASGDLLLDRMISLLTTYFPRSCFPFYVIYSTCIIPLFHPSYLDQYLHNYVIYRKCGNLFSSNVFTIVTLKNLQL